MIERSCRSDRRPHSRQRDLSIPGYAIFQNADFISTTSHGTRAGAVAAMTTIRNQQQPSGEQTMNTSILAMNFDALTLDQLDTVSGGSFWSGVVHIAHNVVNSAKVVAQDMVSGAAVGGAGGAAVGALGGPGGIAGAGAVGGAGGAIVGASYGIAHEISKYVK
jgi:hypothetical protein